MHFNITIGLDRETLHFILLWLMHRDDPAKLEAAAAKLKEKSDALQAALDASKTTGT